MTLRAVEEIDRNPNLNLPQIRRCRRRQPPPTQRRHDDPSTKVTRKERRMESSGSLGRMFTTRRRYGTNRRLGGSMFRFSVVVLLLLTTDSVSSLANETLADSSTLSPSNQTYSIAQRPVLEISQAEPEGFLAEAYWHLHHLYVRRRLKQLYTRFVSIIKQVPWKWVIHLLVFLWHGYQPLRSIHTDTWQAERDPDRVYGRSTRITQHSHRRIVKRRVRQAQTIRRLVGAGYTPRLVWLFGVMLRGIIHCTPLPSIFQPPLGWGAGCVVAANYAHREWIPVILLGWFGSDLYWDVLFDVNGSLPQQPVWKSLSPKELQSVKPTKTSAKSFRGIPITIQTVRIWGK